MSTAMGTTKDHGHDPRPWTSHDHDHHMARPLSEALAAAARLQPEVLIDDAARVAQRCWLQPALPRRALHSMVVPNGGGHGFMVLSMVAGRVHDRVVPMAVLMAMRIGVAAGRIRTAFGSTATRLRSQQVICRQACWPARGRVRAAGGRSALELHGRLPMW